MESQETECVQTFNIEKDCGSLVNPLFFTTYLSVEKGRAVASREVNVTIDSAYTFNVTTLSYTQITDLQEIQASVLTKDSTTNTCTCTGAVKEIHYTANVTPKSASGSIDRPYFDLTSISASAVVFEDPIVGPCDSNQ